MSCAAGCCWVTCWGAESCSRCLSIRRRDGVLLLDTDDGYDSGTLTDAGARQITQDGRASALYRAVWAACDDTVTAVEILTEVASVALGRAALDYATRPDHLPARKTLLLHARAFGTACNLGQEDP